MKPAEFEAAVRTTMRRRGMDASGTILVACSGGPDSLALLCALHRLGLDVEIAHFDHAVREGSQGDAAFVARQAKRLGVLFHTERADAVPRPGASPEEGLREARLAFLEHVASKRGATAIATGHTRDDQAETVLMRIVTGAGRRGLAGIPPVRGPFIRPLIDLGREDTESYCKALRLTPRRDPTNQDQAFLRNAIRADLMPHIERGYNSAIASSLARAADVFRDEDALLDALVADAVAIEAKAGSLRVEVSSLAALHPALQRRAIRRLAPLDARQTEAVRRLVLEGTTGDRIDLAQGLNAALEYGWLVLGPAPSPPVWPERSLDEVALEVPGQTDLPGWKARMRAFVTPKPPFFPDGVAVCAVDADAAGDALVVRRPRPGERFRPLGMTRSKKLGDFFTDAKVLRSERTATPVIAGKDGIVWVVGHRIDDRCKVARTTKRVLTLQWEPYDTGGAPWPS